MSQIRSKILALATACSMVALACVALSPPAGAADAEGPADVSSGINIAIAPPTGPIVPGTPTAATVTLTAVGGVGAVTIASTGAGSAAVTGGPASEPALTDGSSESFDVTFSGTLTPPAATNTPPNGTVGEISVEADTTRADGLAATAVADFFIDSVSASTGNPKGFVTISLNGTLDTQLQALDIELADGDLTSTTYATDRSELLGAEDPAAPAPVVVAPGAVAKPAATATISGTVKYKDSAGGLHPSRGITVEVLAVVGGVPTTMLTTTTTDQTGAYSVQIDATKAPNGIVVRAIAQNAAFVVRDPALKPADPADHIDSAVVKVANGGAATVALQADNVKDNNTAFAVADALTIATAYGTRITTALKVAAFPQILVSFPDASAGTSVFAAGTPPTAKILHDDRFDVDVILHEYGHFVYSQLLGIALPGGEHSFSQQQSTRAGRTKDQGDALAFSEGFATYLAISAENVLNVAALKIPNAGDTFYDDTEDAFMHVDLNSVNGHMAKGAADAPMTPLGEDDELAVARALYDLFDSAANPGDDRGVALGDVPILKDIVDSKATTFSTFYTQLVIGQTPQTVVDEGCILSQQSIAPTVTSPANLAAVTSATPPKVTWTPNGGGHPNNSFTVQFYSSTFKLLYTSPTTTATNFTPGAANWQKITTTSGGTVNVAVAGSSTDATVTGPYIGCNIALAIGPPPGTPEAPTPLLLVAIAGAIAVFVYRRGRRSAV